MFKKKNLLIAIFSLFTIITLSCSDSMETSLENAEISQQESCRMEDPEEVHNSELLDWPIIPNNAVFAVFCGNDFKGFIANGTNDTNDNLAFLP